jgi:hypothetical protein
MAPNDHVGALRTTLTAAADWAALLAKPNVCTAAFDGRKPSKRIVLPAAVILLQNCAAALAQAGITPKDAEAAARKRLAAKRNSRAGLGAAAAAGHQSHGEDGGGEDDDQQQLQDELQDSDIGDQQEQQQQRPRRQQLVSDSDEEQGSSSSSSSSSSSDDNDSSSDEDEPAGKPPAAGTGRTPGSRGAMAGPAAPYSHILLDELRAACTELGLRPKPKTKQVGVARILMPCMWCVTAAHVVARTAILCAYALQLCRLSVPRRVFISFENVQRGAVQQVDLSSAHFVLTHHTSQAMPSVCSRDCPSHALLRCSVCAAELC